MRLVSVLAVTDCLIRFMAIWRVSMALSKSPTIERRGEREEERDVGDRNWEGEREGERRRWRWE